MTQRTWRLIGVVCLAIAGVLAWFGDAFSQTKPDWAMLAVYWGAFVIALFIALYMAWLDLHHLRYQYLYDERDLYKETLGNEEFMRAVREAQEEERRERAAREIK